MNVLFLTHRTNVFELRFRVCHTCKLKLVVPLISFGIVELYVVSKLYGLSCGACHDASAARANEAVEKGLA